MYLLTRPLPKLETSINAFRQAGLAVTGVATSDISPNSDTEAKLVHHLATATVPDAIIVTSVFAAKSLLHSLPLHAASSPLLQVPVVAVGRATADLLAASFAQVITPDTHTSEGILRLPLLNSAKCQHIVIIKGEGGRTAIHATLRTRHKQVTSFCVYQRTPLAVPVTSHTVQFDAVCGIVATSEELGLQLLQHYHQYGIAKCPWVTVSDRVADALRTQGVHNIRVCAGASDSALIEWIKNNWE